MSTQRGGLFDSPPFASRRWEILIGILILVGVLGSLAGLETFLRVLEVDQFGEGGGAVEESTLYMVDETTGLRRLRPGARSGSISVNSYGFRGPEVSAESGGKVVQIAFLGHSTTLDLYTGEMENWPHLVAQGVAGDLPDCKVEFMNGGVPGYSTDLMVQYFDTYVRPHKPVLTFLLTTDHDRNLNVQAKAQGLALYSETRNQSWLAKNSLLFAKIFKNATILTLMRSAHSEMNKLKPDWGDLDSRFTETLESAVEHLGSSGTQVALITTAQRLRSTQSKSEQLTAARSELEFSPYASIPTLLELHERYNRIVIDTARKYDALLVGDGDSIPGTAESYVDSSHFTPVGSRTMAQRVMRELHNSTKYQGLLEILTRRCREQLQ